VHSHYDNEKICIKEFKFMERLL